MARRRPKIVDVNPSLKRLGNNDIRTTGFDVIWCDHLQDEEVLRDEEEFVFFMRAREISKWFPERSIRRAVLNEKRKMVNIAKQRELQEAWNERVLNTRG